MIYGVLTNQSFINLVIKHNFQQGKSKTVRLHEKYLKVQKMGRCSE